MRNYEVVLIVHPDLEETALTGVVDKVKGWITESGGSILKADVWGKRRMAYRINKQRDGQYVYMVATFEPKYNAELERNLRFTEPVMRFLVTARQKPLADGE